MPSSFLGREQGKYAPWVEGCLKRRDDHKHDTAFWPKERCRGFQLPQHAQVSNRVQCMSLQRWWGWPLTCEHEEQQCQFQRRDLRLGRLDLLRDVVGRRFVPGRTGSHRPGHGRATICTKHATP